VTTPRPRSRASRTGRISPVKYATVVLVASMIGGLSLAAQSPAVPAPSREAHEIPDVFPGDPKVDPFALTANTDSCFSSALLAQAGQDGVWSARVRYSKW